MERRKFLQKGLLAGFAGYSILQSSRVVAGTLSAYSEKTFNLNYAPHGGMFKAHAGEDFLDQIRFMHDQGFRSIEDNGFLKRSKEEQENIGKLLGKLGMSMGVFVITLGDNTKVGLTTGKQEFTDDFLNKCKDSIEAAKRCNAKWLTVVPGAYERKLPLDMQTANVIEAMRKGAALLEPHNLIMVLEPLSDSPEQFLRFSHQTYLICKAVNSPSCKILFDMYHMQKNEGNIITNLDMCWDEIAYLQIGDNPGRKEPTTGEMNYQNILKHIYGKGYKGILGMEHGNFHPGKEGEKLLISAYRKVDNFR
jgi:hydroxypyruvate isomerase